jgi:hypothetical protein
VALWRGRTNSSIWSRSTRSFVAILRGMSASLP